MHFSSLLTSLLAVAPLVAAHGDGVPGAPKIFGKRSQDGLAQDGVLGKRALSRPHHMHKRDHMHKRSHLSERAGGTDGQCGSGKGTCAAGYCCSGGGWCGRGTDYCAAPDCQFNYGPGCDANTVPPGASTSGVARTKVGNVLYGGEGIYDCTVPNLIALTYDDGPYIYTSQMLDILARYNVKATFFITGNNLGKGPLDNAYYPWVDIVKRMYNEGHQIASHTWSHQDLSTQVTKAQRLNQMRYNEMAIRNILGVFPTYMRPPYSSCSSASGCQSDMADLGYHITYFDVDTEDYLNTLPSQIQTAKNDFYGNISRLNPSVDDALVIAHDIHQQTALNLTEYMITSALAKGWRFGTVGECLGDPKANWYRSSSGSVYTSAPGSASTTSTTSSRTSTTTSTAPSSSATIISQDAQCGGTTGQTCLGSTFGNCCSRNGWCGGDINYCGDGCQPGFGNCGASAVSSSSSSAPSSSSSSSSTTSSRTTTTSSSPTSSSSSTTSSTTSTRSSSSTTSSSSPTTSSTSSTSSTSTRSSTTSTTSSSSSSSAAASSSTTTRSSTSSTSTVSTTSSTSTRSSTSTTSSTSTSTRSSTSSTSSTSTRSTVSTTTSRSSSRTTTSSAASPSSSLIVSDDATCGGTTRQTCLGSGVGNCCSQYGWCGYTSDHCMTGCQPGFGKCGAAEIGRT